MKALYDFSKGKRGQFHEPDAVFTLPVYLDPEVQTYLFSVPNDARGPQLQAGAKPLSIGKHVDDAMVAIERDNPRMKGALNKHYGRTDLDKHRLGELIDLIGSIQLADVAACSKDLLGRVFEYFLTQFASTEGKNSGQFYTPSCVVGLLVEMLSPYKGRIYDPLLRFRRHVRAIRKIRRSPRRQAGH